MQRESIVQGELKMKRFPRLVVNTPAVMNSSRGVQRYYKNVIENFRWPGDISELQAGKIKYFKRAREILQIGERRSILWTPCQRGPILAFNHVVTVHDFINIEYIYRSDIRLPAYRFYMNKLLLNSRAIVSISYATKNAILRNFSIPHEKIYVIQSGMNSISNVKKLSRTYQGKPFVLLVTNDLPHKNSVLTCQAWARSRGPAEGIELRVVGKLPVEALNICRNIPFSISTWLDDIELLYSYQSCRFLIAPSLSEGHDLPVAEALMAGSDVLCSDIDAHREYFQSRVKFFDPLREESIVNAINDALIAPRPWFLHENIQCRSFSDVSREYESLFRNIGISL